MSDEKKRKIAETLFNTGQNAFKSQNFDYAANCFLKCTKLVPDKLPFRQSLRAAARKKYKDNGKGASGAGLRSGGSWMSIKLAKTRKKWHDVIEAAEDILSINPWDVDAMLEICHACKEIPDMDETAYWCGKVAIETNKERKDTYLVHAEVCERMGKFGEALYSLEQAKRIDPMDTELPMRIRQMAAQSTIDTGGYEPSEDGEGEGAEGEEGSEKPKPTPVIRPAPPKEETAEEKLQKEIDEIEARIADDPKNSFLYVQMGDTYRRAGDTSRALKAYDRGYKACDNDRDLRMRFLELRIDQLRNGMHEAQDYIDKLDKAMPDYAEKLAKANTHVSAAKTTIAKAEVELYKHRVDENPDDFSSALELGVRLYDAEKFDEAIKYLQRARGEMRQKWKALMYLGLCFWQKKNYSLADKNLSDALPMIPALDEKGKKEVMYYRGRVAEDAGNNELAIDCYNEVAAIDYAFRDVADRLDKLTGNMG